MSAGPDFSSIDSLAKAEERWRRGELERLFLLPPEFDGRDVAENVVYVPLGIAAVKQGIDLNAVRPLVLDGQVSRYNAVPEYQGDSFVPIAITITASAPGHFSSTINIWGDALSRTDNGPRSS